METEGNYTNTSSLLNPSYTNCNVHLDSTAVKVVKTVAFCVLMALSVFGNSLVIVAFVKTHRLRTKINYFILTMSVSDVFTAVFSVPKQILYIHAPASYWPFSGGFGSLLCKFTPFTEVTSIIVSVISLQIIAIERFFSVVYPMKRQPISKSRTCFIFIAFSWILGVAWSSSYFYTFRIVNQNTTDYCIYSWEPLDTTYGLKIQLSLFLVCFTMVPFILLTCLYSAIVCSLYCPTTSLHWNQSSCRSRENKKVTVMLVVVVVVFLVSWLPYMIDTFLFSFILDSHKSCELRHLLFITNFLSFIYPAVNPFIYYIFSENYRKGINDLLHCHRLSRTCCKENGEFDSSVANSIPLQGGTVHFGF